MRQFRSYSRVRIARYVKGFFNGSLTIEGQGGYQFRHGRLLLPEQAGISHQQTVSEINQTIRELERNAA